MKQNTAQAIKDLTLHNLPYIFSYRQCYFVGKQTGIKEVVDWILSQSDYDCGHFVFDIDQDVWNAKLKEWKISPSTI